MTYAHREKDRIWIEALYKSNLIDMQVLYQRLAQIPMPFEMLQSLQNDLQAMIDGNNCKWPN
ncbi:MAG: hypothetical protein BZ138_06265 [Methanosphaera sp. rholeuAM270]|nr:MAG: hypothetical protein BZ138_06265 [Methanosphaera sp. rholeuAM270]